MFNVFDILFLTQKGGVRRRREREKIEREREGERKREGERERGASCFLISLLGPLYVNLS